MNRIPALLAIAWLALGIARADEPAPPPSQSLEAGERGVTAPSIPGYSVDSPPAINRLDFDFRLDETRGWLNKDGDFQVTGWIKHGGLLCGTYRMGLRFGIGAPGCLNVKWITETRFVTREVQCNGARMQHLGGDTDTEAGTAVGKITCAERVITCSGSCK
jgi:hypothetical protein